MIYNECMDRELTEIKNHDGFSMRRHFIPIGP
jgi:hypothetical protein